MSPVNQLLDVRVEIIGFSNLLWLVRSRNTIKPSSDFANWMLSAMFRLSVEGEILIEITLPHLKRHELVEGKIRLNCNLNIFRFSFDVEYFFFPCSLQ